MHIQNVLFSKRPHSQNVPSLNVPSTKRPTAQNVPLSKRPTPKTSHTLNVPWHKTSHGTKRPKKTSHGTKRPKKTSHGTKCPPNIVLAFAGRESKTTKPILLDSHYLEKLSNFICVVHQAISAWSALSIWRQRILNNQANIAWFTTHSCSYI